MCRMSARWNLCKCCCSCSGKVDDREPHFYCGCEESNSKRSKLKMYTDELSSEDIDKQTLIFSGDESTESDNTEIRKKDEWLVHSPSVGFESEFGSYLEADRDIKIFGTVLPDAISFTVNLCRIVEKEMDIGFHLNPRFDQQYIARNSKLNGKWGIEEAQTYCRFPLARGKKFFIEIFMTHNEFMVAIDGLHYCAFSYRYPLFDLNRIEIFGDISLQKVEYGTSKFYPNELPEDLLPKGHNFLSISRSETKILGSNELNCVAPLVISLKDKLTIGTEIDICGRVKLLPHSFYVNLQQGKLNCPHPVINLHVNARFREKPNRGCCTILCNSWIGDDWGTEQLASRDSYFFAGQNFSLKIKCESEAFILLHNESTIMSFVHRSDFSRINTLYIVGDIFVNNITFQ